MFGVNYFLRPRPRNLRVGDAPGELALEFQGTALGKGEAKPFSGRKPWLCRSNGSKGHSIRPGHREEVEGGGLSTHPAVPERLRLAQANVHTMIQRRALAARIGTKISCHSFRATGITTYLQNGGKLEVASRWPATSPPAPPASTTAATTPWLSTRSNEWCIAAFRLCLQGQPFRNAGVLSASLPPRLVEEHPIHMRYRRRRPNSRAFDSDCASEM